MLKELWQYVEKKISKLFFPIPFYFIMSNLAQLSSVNLLGLIEDIPVPSTRYTSESMNYMQSLPIIFGCHSA